MKFQTGIQPKDVLVRFVNQDLVVSLINRGERVTFQNYLNANTLQEVRFTDSPDVWDVAKIKTQAFTAVYGQQSMDTLYGTDSNDSIDAGETYATVYGGVGDDTISGGDYLFGGAGNDTYIIGHGATTITIGTESSSNQDVIVIPLPYAGTKFTRDYNKDGMPELLRIYVPDIGVSFSGTSGIDVTDFFQNQGPNNVVKEIRFTDKTLTRADVLAMDPVSIKNDANNRIFGYHWANVIDAMGGDDFVQTYEGDDSIKGGDGKDEIYTGSGTDTVDAGTGNDSIYVGYGNDLIDGGAGNDSIMADYGMDTLSGGTGNDLLRGYAGSDVYKFGLQQGEDTIQEYTETLTEIDTIVLDADIAEKDVALMREGDDLILGIGIGAQRAQLRVSAQFAITTGYDKKIEVIHFNSGADWKAADIASRLISGMVNNMAGGVTDDVFTVDNTQDVVTEASSVGGTDVINTSVSYTLPDNVENMTMTGWLSGRVIGNSLNNRLTGNTGNNVFYEQGGDDTLIGGMGDDIYYVNIETIDLSNDKIVELANEGADTVITNAYSYNLPDNVENLFTQAYSNKWGDGWAIPWFSNQTRMINGNAANNVINANGGNGASIRIDGGAGADTMYGTGATFVVDDPGDMVITSSGNIETSIQYSMPNGVYGMALTGSSPISAIGNDGMNTLNGRKNSASNLLAGGKGDDNYLIGQADIVQENPDEGLDTIYVETTDSFGKPVQSATSTYTLLDNFEDIVGDNFNNNFTGNKQNNRMDGSGGDDALYGLSGDDSLLGGIGNDTLDGGEGNDTLTSDIGNDWLYGGSGNDTYYAWGEAGVDHIKESDTTAGNLDVIRIDSTITNLKAVEKIGSDLSIRYATSSQLIVQDFFLNPINSIELFKFNDATWNATTIAAVATANAPVNGGTANDSLTGTASHDRLAGLDGSDTLVGLAGIDWLDGGVGNDSLNGGADNDSLYGGAGDDAMDGGAGQDYLRGGADNDSLTGGLENDALFGDNGNDTLDGGSGVDSMDGGDGNDIYYVDDINDVISDTNGVDKVYVSGTTTYEVPMSIDEVRLVEGGGSRNLSIKFTVTMQTGTSLYGNSFDNNLQGSYQKDYLDGGLGNDTMFGGDGDDTYIVSQAGDIVSEIDSAGYNTDGNDTVNVYGLTAYTLPQNVETGVLVSTGTSGATLTGNGSYNTLTGYSYNDVLTGGLGNDTLIGNGGDDMLDGGEDNDNMSGGQGDDIYIVDSAVDKVTEQANQGTDSVRSSVTYILGNDVENLTLTGDENITGTGNQQVNVLIGNVGRNVLSGDAGDDTLLGGVGDDTVYGGDGNDVLKGEAGEDSMVGGLGSDTYVVDNVDDIVIEQATPDDPNNNDIIETSVSYTAPLNVETLMATGTGNINLTSNADGCDLAGNVGNNYLKGGDGLDFIYGDEGIDTLEGGAGDDYYYLADNLDTVIEKVGDGLDQIWAYGNNIKIPDNVERLYMQSSLAVTAYGNEGNNYLTGNNRNNTLYGNGGNDKLWGLSGNDVFYGGTGNDVLTGAGGNDTYHFQRGDGADTITDIDGTAGNKDTLALDGAISANQVWFAKSGSDLVVSVIGTADQVTVSGWFIGSTYQVESFVAAGNGKTLSNAKVQGLVNAMAGFTPPAAGQTTLPANYQTALNSVIASSWV